MIRLLMLDFDSRLIGAVARALEQEDIAVQGVASVECARAELTREHYDAALLDSDLLSAADLTAFAHIPLLLSTSFLEPEGEHRFFRRAPLLRKPFTGAQLLSALHEACESSRTPPPLLVDVLRHAHSSGQSLAVRIGGAEVFVEQGELIHAECQDASGEAALVEALTQTREELVTIPQRTVQRTIDRPFQALMLDLLRHIDERERSEAQRMTNGDEGRGP